MKNTKSSSSSMDRISQLPEALLHHILYFLPQNEAARTCVLSKAWRRTWATRPNIEFRINSFKGTRQEFLSLINKTLQVYHDRKLCVEEFVFENSKGIFESKSESESSNSLLDKWIPIVMHMGGINKFVLWTEFNHAYDLPRAVFQAQSLQELYLRNCKLYQIGAPNHNLHLKKLCLIHVYIRDENFQKIISSCPLIEDIQIALCVGFRIVKVNKLHNLKNFSFSNGCYDGRGGTSIEINKAPKLETLFIYDRVNWVPNHHHMFYNLKCLTLREIQLSRKSFDYFSCNLLRLEKLIIFDCYGFEELQLRSQTIKQFDYRGKSLKATIDAPNMLYFQYGGIFIPSLSSTTISSECKSDISIHLSPLLHDVSSWFLKLKEMLKALSKSEISLDIHLCKSIPKQIENTLVLNCEQNIEVPQVVVECLHFSFHSSISSPLLNAFFHIFRPMKIEHYWFAFSTKINTVAKFLWKSLMERNNLQNEELIKQQYFWQQDLEEVSMETFDESREKWLPFQGKNWSECAMQSTEKQGIRFHLKWREASLNLI